MIGVKRWEPRDTIVGFDMEPRKDGSFVLSCDYDSAQVELAALREELVSRNEVIAMKAREVVEAQTAVTGWADKCRAAEQRNAGITELLRMVQKAARKQGWAFGYPELFNAVDAALTKPTESGASK